MKSDRLLTKWSLVRRATGALLVFAIVMALAVPFIVIFCCHFYYRQMPLREMLLIGAIFAPIMFIGLTVILVVPAIRGLLLLARQERMFHVSFRKARLRWDDSGGDWMLLCGDGNLYAFYRGFLVDADAEGYIGKRYAMMVTDCTGKRHTVYASPEEVAALREWIEKTAE